MGVGERWRDIEKLGGEVEKESKKHRERKKAVRERGKRGVAERKQGKRREGKNIRRPKEGKGRGGECEVLHDRKSI